MTVSNTPLNTYYSTLNTNSMSKSKWGMPAYKGKPHPLKAANRFMLILVIILLAGFIKAGMREGWFESILSYFGY